MKGIVQQMRDKGAFTIKTSTITREMIEEAFRQVYIPPERQMRMYTGEAGMFMFNWAITFGDTIEVKNFKGSFKRIKGMYFSLFTKHGKYKLYVLGKTFTVYEGTKVIKVFTDVQSTELMDFKIFDKPQIHIDKMKVISNYLKKLENGSK